VSRSGVKILITGRNLNDPVAEFVSDYSKLRSGDKVVTMSDGLIVPPDIPIGEIIDPNERPVRVRLFAHDASLDYVKIIQQIPSKVKPRTPTEAKPANTGDNPVSPPAPAVTAAPVAPVPAIATGNVNEE
jgi:rod shape-determining protein MreC